jgi:hypothetical protein
MATAAPTISSVTPGSGSVGKYEKQELAVGLTASYTNAYDPTQIDLSATFTSPTGKTQKVNGFYDGSKWKVRFAGNEVGTYSYTVTAKDATGTTTSPSGTFAVAASNHHGWVRIAPNKKFFAYDDGTSFFGVGACEAWGPSTTTLNNMQKLGYNSWIYWNGTYDGSGGNVLLESPLGSINQGKATRIDSLISWSEQRDLTMILVVWAHDYLCNSSGSCPSGWPSAWSSNPYNGIVSAANFYTDATAWTHQENLYRYIIARWGYSRALQGYQTIDEIGGTDGWVASQTNANAWAAKIAAYFQQNDPFRHLTNGSQGSYWPQGNAANDVANTEDYGNYTATGVASIGKQLWTNNPTKPGIMGETGLGSPQPTLWGALSSGVAATPFLWQFQSSGDGWSTADETVYPPIVNFTKSIDFAALQSPAQASPTVSGATAIGMTSAHVSWGYITGSFSGKSLSLSGLTNDSYTLEWWNCTAGTLISSNSVSVTGGTLSAAIPSTSGSDIAYKLSSSTTTSVSGRSALQQPSDLSVSYTSGRIRLSRPMTESGDTRVLDARGRTVAELRIGSSTDLLPIGPLANGAYRLQIRSGGAVSIHSFLVEE